MVASVPKPFVDRLLASQLLEAEQVKAAQTAAGNNDNALADYLVKQGLLTRFQVRQLRAGACRFSLASMSWSIASVAAAMASFTKPGIA